MTEALDTNYARAGYHARQAWGRRPALILIDFAMAYFDPDAPLYGGEGCQTRSTTPSAWPTPPGKGRFR
jgi:maleamate amidohydrolase